jgi:hypothetical protein
MTRGQVSGVKAGDVGMLLEKTRVFERILHDDKWTGWALMVALVAMVIRK